MKPLRAYSLILLAFFLPVGCSLATYEGRGGLFPFRMGMLLTDLIAYGILFYVAILATIALYKTFEAGDKSQSGRKELSVRLVMVIGLMISPLFTGEPTYGWNEADFAKKISVELEGNNYSVPVKYLDRYWKEDGKIASVSLVALLPNMEPRTLSNKEEFMSHKDGGGRHINITLRKAEPPDPRYPIGKYGDYSNKAIFVQYELGLYNKSLENKFGLNFYGSSGSPFHKELFVADDQASGVYFSCDEDKENTFPSCDTRVPYRGNVILEYRFRKTYLKDWKSIQSRVLSLIASLDMS